MAIVNSSDVLLLQEDNSLYDPEPSENRRKRKRIPIACDACRARKSRCDGGRPKCSGCVTQEVGCVYATHPSTASTAAGSMRLIEARLLAIERDIREIKKTRRPAPSPTAPPAADREDERTEDEAGAGISPGLTDGVGTIEFAIQQTPAFFGPSSNIAFTRLVRRSIFTKLYGPEPIPRRERHVNFPFHRQDQLVISRLSTPDLFKPPKTWPSASAPTAVQLPPEDEVIRLVKVFFSDTAILFPYIHEESFWETFKSAARSNFRHVGSSWLGLLYMILAMAISTTPDATGSNQPASNSDRYFVCAQSLCLNRREVDASLEAIQVMLLMVQYLQGTRRSVQTWTIHGDAVRAAFQLGLHSSETLAQFGPLEQEVRIRTWYCCIVLDRTLSLTFGRSAAIPEQYIRIQLPNHVFPSSSNGTEQTQWCAEESSTLFWNATITLYRILNQGLDYLYESNLGSGIYLPVAEITSSSLSMEQKLISWQSSLPSSITLIQASDIPPNGEGSILHKLRVVLTLRFHNTRILIHRPIIDRYLQLLSGLVMDEQEVATLQQLMSLSKGICLESARSIIDLIATILTPCSRQREYSRAWWFTLYYTFNAALTVAATLLCDRLSLEALQITYQISEDNKNSLLDRVISCLPLLDSNGRMAEKCARFMTAIRYYIQELHNSDTSKNGRDNPSGSTTVSPAQPLSYPDKTTSSSRNAVDWPFTSSLDFSIPEFDPKEIISQDFGCLFELQYMDEFGQVDLLV